MNLRVAYKEREYLEWLGNEQLVRLHNTTYRLSAPARWIPMLNGRSGRRLGTYWRCRRDASPCMELGDAPAPVQAFVPILSYLNPIRTPAACCSRLQLVELLKHLRPARLVQWDVTRAGSLHQRYSAFFVPVTPTCNFPSTLYPQSCWCIIRVIHSL
jgi:hypothetical protein